MDLSLFQPYTKPKSGFCAHYKAIVKNGRVLVEFWHKGEFTIFRRVWLNHFGGGVGKTMVLFRKLPLKGGFTMPSDIYESMLNSSEIYDSKTHNTPSVSE